MPTAAIWPRRTSSRSARPAPSAPVSAVPSARPRRPDGRSPWRWDARRSRHIRSSAAKVGAVPPSKGPLMPAFPEDIFTEPERVDPDTLANLGPLRRLAGGWEGPGGVDINPKAVGPEQRAFLERSLFQPIDPQAN